MPNCFSKTKQARMMIMYLLENKLSKTYLLLHFSKTIDHTQEVQIRKQAVATPVRFSDGSRQGLTMEKSTVVVSVPVVVMAETAETDYSSSFSMQSPRKMLGRVINQGIRELLRSLQYIRSIVLRWQTLFNSGGQLLQLPV
ncbi:Auxin responsive protein [Zea mays]|uniref:Auxin responsive protein n=1 Tax=Zea mays TaxID=4577 RepID=A0A1D6DZB6_MAIZE|nr:Auxin responsive protein [Zea mays]